MAPKQKLSLAGIYAACLTIIAPFCKTVYKTLRKAQQEKLPKRVVLLISRPLDVELLIRLHEQANERKDLNLFFWVTQNCVSRYPGILTQLKEKQLFIEMIVSFSRLGEVLGKFMETDAFLSVVESTTAKHKLPYQITLLANAAGVSTYTLQHGFENVGLTYCDEIHGPDVKFAAKTVLTWGPVEELPAWVSKETRDKSVAVGCPKKSSVLKNEATAATSARPIIGIFDNLHWHRYDENYVAKFLGHLEETATKWQKFRFVLKSHPDSVRNRSRELAARLGSMKHVDIADMLGGEEPELTTPWLLTHALGVITTPSTIALDGALAGVPVAVTRYGLDLSYYSPLSLLDNLADWQLFLDRLMDASEYSQLKLNGERFLGRVLVPGDPATKILDLMAGQ